jgi:hypothetical protein
MRGERRRPALPTALVIESGYLELEPETRSWCDGFEPRLRVSPKSEGTLSVWELVVEERSEVPTEYYLG